MLVSSKVYLVVLVLLLVVLPRQRERERWRERDSPRANVLLIYFLCYPREAMGSLRNPWECIGTHRYAYVYIRESVCVYAQENCEDVSSQAPTQSASSASFSSSFSVAI